MSSLLLWSPSSLLMLYLNVLLHCSQLWTILPVVSNLFCHALLWKQKKMFEDCCIRLLVYSRIVLSVAKRIKLSAPQRLPCSVKCLKQHGLTEWMSCDFQTCWYGEFLLSLWWITGCALNIKPLFAFCWALVSHCFVFLVVVVVIIIIDAKSTNFFLFN